MSTTSDNDRKKGSEKDAKVLSQLGEDPGAVVVSQGDSDNNTNRSPSKKRLERENYEAISGQAESTAKSDESM